MPELSNRRWVQVRRGKQLQASTFPEAILNGAQLDLNALYRAVCSRGGFAMGTGVNWAGQVCVCVCVCVCVSMPVPVPVCVCVRVCAT